MSALPPATVQRTIVPTYPSTISMFGTKTPISLTPSLIYAVLHDAKTRGYLSTTIDYLDLYDPLRTLLQSLLSTYEAQHALIMASAALPASYPCQACFKDLEARIKKGLAQEDIDAVRAWIQDLPNQAISTSMV
jgi:hypothetical protein